jgi:branched-chain amino acid transport system ATP-binding protein
MARSRRCAKLDLCLEEGQIVTVIGPNGAGKTTMLAASWACCRPGPMTYDGQPLLAHHDVERIDKAWRWCRKARTVRRDERRGQPAAGRLPAHRRGHRDHQQTMDEVFGLFPRTERRTSRPAPCRAASARCWPSAAR